MLCAAELLPTPQWVAVAKSMRRSLAVLFRSEPVQVSVPPTV
jgi:hypothetical protein